MGNVLINESNLSAIASAIRTKNGQSTTYKPREMAPAILAISGGTGDGVVWQDSEGYIHLSEDEAGTIILTSLSATANGTYSASYPNAYSQVTVNVGPARSAANLTASGSTVTVPSGYYSSQVTKNVAAGSAFPPAVTITKAPTITVNASGVVTATYTGSSSITPTVTAGYVAAGTAGTISTTGTSTYQLTSKAAATYNTSTADQTIASQRWLVGAQTIKSVTTSNLAAANIKSGVVVKVGDANNASRITQVTGTYAPTISSVTVTPTETAQTFNATGVDGYKPVVVNAISSTYVGTGITTRSAANLTASGSTVTVPAGYYSAQATKNVASTTHPNPTAAIASSTGVVTATHTQTAGYVAAGTTTGTLNLTTQAAQTITPGSTAKTIASYRWLTGTQTIAGDSNLVAENIAEGVSIFGVTGSHSGGSKRTATIKSGGVYSSGMVVCAVRYPASSSTSNYYVEGNTFEFSSGEIMKCVMQPLSSSSTTTVFVNGESIYSASSGGSRSYDYTLPDCDIDIYLSTDASTININIVSKKFVATVASSNITTTRSMGIKYDLDTYYNKLGESFCFNDGDSAILQVYDGLGNAKIYIDDEVVASSGQDPSVSYNYTMPSGDITIEVYYANYGGSYVKIYTHPALLLSIIDCTVTTSKTGVIFGAIFDPYNDNMVGVNLFTGSWSSSGMPFNILVNNPSTENPLGNLITFLTTSTCTITTNSSAEDLTGDPATIGNCYLYTIGIVGDNPTITIT